MITPLCQTWISTSSPTRRAEGSALAAWYPWRADGCMAVRRDIDYRQRYCASQITQPAFYNTASAALLRGVLRSCGGIMLSILCLGGLLRKREREEASLFSCWSILLLSNIFVTFKWVLLLSFWDFRYFVTFILLLSFFWDFQRRFVTFILGFFAGVGVSQPGPLPRWSGFHLSNFETLTLFTETLFSTKKNVEWTFLHAPVVLSTTYDVQHDVHDSRFYAWNVFISVKDN